jgi:beta-aspartyl-dipeptidase (metallo-type)
VHAGKVELIATLAWLYVMRINPRLIFAMHRIFPIYMINRYRFPSKTITGSVQRDLVMIPDCLGVGEVAISDHRSSQPNAHELARLAEDTRVGGMMAGKGGLVHVHVGPGKGRLKPLRDALALSNGDIPISTVRVFSDSPLNKYPVALPSCTPH